MRLAKRKLTAVIHEVYLYVPVHNDLFNEAPKLNGRPFDRVKGYYTGNVTIVKFPISEICSTGGNPFLKKAKPASLEPSVNGHAEPRSIQRIPRLSAVGPL